MLQIENPHTEVDGQAILKGLAHQGVTVRAVIADDAAELAELLNAIIAEGGTTALQEPFTADRLADTYLTGPAVHCCFVAIDPATGRLEGFQTLGRYSSLPDDIGDIGTFARIDGKQRGVGSALFAATRDRARELGLVAINATIRADNSGGLAFYSKLGFTDHAITPAVPLSDGVPVDRVHKRYGLKDVDGIFLFDANGPVIAEEQDVLDLIGETWGQGVVTIAALPVERLSDRFFVLSTGLAGALTQKFVNYRIPLAIVGDIAGRTDDSAAFRDFVRESNAGRALWFVPDLDALRNKLNA